MLKMLKRILVMLSDLKFKPPQRIVGVCKYLVNPFASTGRTGTSKVSVLKSAIGRTGTSTEISVFKVSL